jgi:hypothetical protein
MGRPKGSVGKTEFISKTYPADKPGLIADKLKNTKSGVSRHLVLFGRPVDVRVSTPRFTVKVYEALNPDVIEAIEQEQPYRHYLGAYAAGITAADLRDDIEAMIAEKYKAWGLV